jgi:cell division initiation protein
MKILPMEIQRQTFARRMRGFDPEEVRTYLTIVAEEVAALQGERENLAQEAQTLRAMVEDHRQRENILKNTLLTAQRVSEEIKENARRHAENVVKEAELQADKLLELAQRRAYDVEKAILDLRSYQSGLRTEIRSFITRIGSLLDMQEEADDQDNVRFLKRREEAQ